MRPLSPITEATYCDQPPGAAPRSMYLVELALDMCRDVLAPNGSFIVKIFQGEGFEEYLKAVRDIFRVVKIRKPEASRARSREVYIVASGRK